MNDNEILIQYIRDHSTELKPVPTGVEPVLRVPGTIKALVFDVYGTLFISASGDISLADPEIRKNAAEKAWTDAGLPSVNEQEPAVTLLSRAFRQEITERHEMMKNKGVDFPEIDVIEVWSAVFERTYGFVPGDEKIRAFALAWEVNVNPVWPMPGLADMLDYLAEKGIKTGIVSNAQFYTPLLFPALTGKTMDEWKIDTSLCQWSYVCRRGKPDSKMFLNLLRDLNECYNISEAEVLYLGNDMLNDIWTASTCGMKTALFAGDRRSLRMREDREQCRNLHPDAIITDLNQIRDIIE